MGISWPSGGITSSMAYQLAREGIGATTLVHVGGDAVASLLHREAMKLFEQDPETKAVVMFGEIGTGQEEMMAELIAYISLDVYRGAVGGLSWAVMPPST